MGFSSEGSSDVCGSAIAFEVVEGPRSCAEWLKPSEIAPQQAVLLGILHATHALLRGAGVRAWLTGGTLIGALRHGGFVPHDDDVDLECMEEDVPQIEQALAQHPHLVGERGGRWGETPMFCVKLPAADSSIDIFLRSDGEPSDAVRRDFPLLREEIFPLREVPFCGLRLPAPRLAERYLTRCYGPDWADSVRVWTHAFNFQLTLAHDPGRVCLPLREYNELVAAAGYRAPEAPPEDAEEFLRDLTAPGGLASVVRALFQATWLENLRRRNAEQAEARLRLSKT